MSLTRTLAGSLTALALVTTAQSAFALDISEPDNFGRIGNWLVLGGFPHGGCYSPLGNVIDPVAAAPCGGDSDAGRTWQQYTPATVGGAWITPCGQGGACNGGYVSSDLNCFYGGVVAGAPDFVMGYAYTNLILDQPMTLRLWSGSDDGYRYWIDGNLALDVQGACRCYGDSQEMVQVTLTAGVHKILVQVGEGGGHWGFVLRATDVNNNPITTGIHADTGTQCCDDPDNDGVCAPDDVCPGFDDHADADMDGIPDGCDPCPLDDQNDVDGDGVCGNVDNCANVYNPTQGDFDNDGSGDACDVRCETLIADADAYIAADQPTSNFGAGALAVGVINNGASVRETLLHFSHPQIPSGALITSGSLFLYQYSRIGGQQALELSLADDAWSEGAVTWQSYGAPSSGALLGTGSNVSNAGLFSIPINTSFPVSAIDDGLVLTQDAGHTMLYDHTSPNYWQKPRLKLCFVVTE